MKLIKKLYKELTEDELKSLKELSESFSLNNNIDEFCLIEKDMDKLGDGIFKVNHLHYVCSFVEMDKYNERRFLFKKFYIDEFFYDLKRGNFVSMDKYIVDTKLIVIEDSTYKIKKVFFI